MVNKKQFAPSEKGRLEAIGTQLVEGQENQTKRLESPTVKGKTISGHL
jgi:hypothetical protein